MLSMEFKVNVGVRLLGSFLRHIGTDHERDARPGVEVVSPTAARTKNRSCGGPLAVPQFAVAVSEEARRICGMHRNDMCNHGVTGPKIRIQLVPVDIDFPNLLFL